MSAGAVSSSRRRSGADTYMISGNDQYFSKSPFSAYTGMWGMQNPQAPGLVASSSMQVTRSTFPNGLVINWDVTPSPSWGGVNGYLYTAYGNYDNSGGGITSKQIKDIVTLAPSVSWTQAGNLASGLLCETWLTSAATPSGPITKGPEIAFFPRFSAHARSWLDSLPLVGSGFVSGGVNYSVRQGGNPQTTPYIIAYRSDYGDIQGVLPFKDFFTYLIAQGKLTGNEWFNGLGFGVEPDSGIGSLTINSFTVAYS